MNWPAQGGAVYSLDVQRQGASGHDPLPVSYARLRLPSTRTFGRLQLPLPSTALWSLLVSKSLHGHLPSPGVLLVLVLARLVRPRQKVTTRGCFLGRAVVLMDFSTRSIKGWLYGGSKLRRDHHIAVAGKELVRAAVRIKVFVLPCCLSQQEQQFNCLCLRPQL